MDGTCTGNFNIQKDLTLSGPATLDGGGIETTYGTTLGVGPGTVVLNDLVIQHGVGTDGLGGGIWNSGQLTLNRSTVTNNTASNVGGVFNFGQLTLNRSTVSHNTATNGGTGGIFNCAASLHDYGLCTGAPGSLTLNNSIVSNNTASGDGGGIVNDGQAVLTLNYSTVSNNVAAAGDGGGILNDGQGVMTLTSSIVSGNSAGHDGGGIENNGTATFNVSTVSANTTGTYGNGGGIENNGTLFPFFFSDAQVYEPVGQQHHQQWQWRWHPESGHGDARFFECVG